MSLFKCYKRKINVFTCLRNKHGRLIQRDYAWSTMAYPTCKAATLAASVLHPDKEFTAYFVK